MKKSIRYGTLWVLLLCLNVIQLSASEKAKGDKAFEHLSFEEAIIHYSIALLKGDSSVISPLAQSYVRVHDYQHAVELYRTLYANKSLFKKEDDLQYFIISLKAINAYQELHKLFKKNHLNEHVIEALKRENYLELIKHKPDYTIKKLNINSAGSDCSPTFMTDKQIAFVSDRKIEGVEYKIHPWSGHHFYNILLADIHKGNYDSLVNVRSISKNINTDLEEASASYDSKSKRIVYSGMVVKKIKKKKSIIKEQEIATIRLMFSDFEVDSYQWTKPKNLIFNVDTNTIETIQHPCFAHDGNVLFFSSDTPWEGHQGKFDIYMIKRTTMGTWSAPINLGPLINTKENEGFPTYHEDGLLYFSSDGRLGLGKLDIYLSSVHFLEDKSLVFSPPIDLAPPINSYADDFGLVFNKDRKHGYFSSDRIDGKGNDDLYAITYIGKEQQKEEEEEEKKKETVTINKNISTVMPKLSVKGVVYNTFTHNPVNSARIFLYNDAGKIIKRQKTKEDGSYSFEIDHHISYSIEAMATKFTQFGQRKHTVQVSDTNKNIVIHNIPLEPEKQIFIEPINFDFNDHKIVEEDKYYLNQIASILKEKPKHITLEIYSHTDCRGNDKYNLKLSNRRAKSTKEYLIKKGVLESQITVAVGMGSEDPIVFCNCITNNDCDELDHRLNRRSEFVLKTE